MLKVGLDGLMVGVDDLVSLSKLKWFYDSMSFILICSSLALSSSFKKVGQLFYKDVLLREGHRCPLCGHHSHEDKYLTLGHTSVGTFQFWDP